MKHHHHKPASIAVSLFLLMGCSVSADQTQPPQPQPACKQDSTSCDACSHQFVPDVTHTSEQLDGFDACYEHSYGDHAKCEAEFPSGATEWRQLVAQVCNTCSSECCDFCSSPWGKLEK